MVETTGQFEPVPWDRLRESSCMLVSISCSASRFLAPSLQSLGHLIDQCQDLQDVVCHE